MATSTAVPEVEYRYNSTITSHQVRRGASRATPREVADHVEVCALTHGLVAKRGVLHMSCGYSPDREASITAVNKNDIAYFEEPDVPKALAWVMYGKACIDNDLMVVIPKAQTPTEPDEQFNDCVDQLRMLLDMPEAELSPSGWQPPQKMYECPLPDDVDRVASRILETLKPTPLPAQPPRSNSLGPRNTRPSLEGLAKVSKATLLAEHPLRELVECVGVTPVTVALPKYNDFKSDGTLRTIYCPNYILDLVLREMFTGLEQMFANGFAYGKLNVRFNYGTHFASRRLPTAEMHSYDLKSAEWQYFPLVKRFYEQNFDFPMDFIDPWMITPGGMARAKYFQSGLYPTSIFNNWYTAAYVCAKAPPTARHAIIDGDGFLIDAEMPRSALLTKNIMNELNGFYYSELEEPRYIRFGEKLLRKRYKRFAGLNGVDLFIVRLAAYATLNMPESYIKLGLFVAGKLVTEATKGIYEAALARDYAEVARMIEKNGWQQAAGSLYSRKRKGEPLNIEYSERFALAKTSKRDGPLLPYVLLPPGKEIKPKKFVYKSRLSYRGKTKIIYPNEEVHGELEPEQYVLLRPGNMVGTLEDRFYHEAMAE